MEREDVIKAMCKLQEDVFGVAKDCYEELDYVIKFLRNPSPMLDRAELIISNQRYEHMCDLDDIKKEIKSNFDLYNSKYNIAKNPITDCEYGIMAYALREVLDEVYDEAWAGRCESVVKEYLQQR
jgi:hypothetical protein